MLKMLFRFLFVRWTLWWSLRVVKRNVPKTNSASWGDTICKYTYTFLYSKKVGPGARFSKVPKLYGPFSGVTIPFVSQERRAFNSSNFTGARFSEVPKSHLGNRHPLVSEKLIFKDVFKIGKRRITETFDVLKALRSRDTEGIVTLEKGMKTFGTFEKRNPARRSFNNDSRDWVGNNEL